jgi:hypothetical protein
MLGGMPGSVFGMVGGEGNAPWKTRISAATRCLSNSKKIMV